MTTDAAVWCRAPQLELWCWLLSRVSSDFAAGGGELRRILYKVHSLSFTNAEHSRHNVTLKAYFGQDVFPFTQMEGWGQTRSTSPQDVVTVIWSFRHILWADHLLSKHSGSVLTKSWRGYRGGLMNVINLAWIAILQPVVLHIDFSFAA